MEFSRLLRNGAKISLTEGVSVFTSNDQSLFLKYNNRLSRMSLGSELVQLLDLFHILRHPKNLEEILKLAPKFKKKEVMDILHALHQRNFVTIQRDKNKRMFNTKELDLKYLMDSMNGKNLVSNNTEITLIGNGILANRLAIILRKMNVKLNQINICSESTNNPNKALIKTVNKKKKGLPKIDSSRSSSFMSSINNSNLIIVAEDYQNISLFESINRICFIKRKTWLRISFDDGIGYLGPLVVPGKTSCFNCCELRLVTNSREYEYELWKNKERIPKTRLRVPEVYADLLSFICVKEVLRYLTNGNDTEAENKLVLFDIRQPNFTKHIVTQHPNCIYCNSVETSKKLHSKSLSTSFKTVIQHITNNDGHDCSNPLSVDEILERLRKIIDPKTGIILEIKKLLIDNPLGITSHYFFYTLCSKPLRIGLNGELAKQVQLGNSLINPTPSGSGLSANEAEMLTLMETIERYSNMCADESRFIWSSYRDIQKIAINPLEMGLYLDERYEQDNKISRFSVDSEIPWIKGQDLYSGKPVFVAADFIHYPPIREKPLVFDSSNGSSAHSNIIYAILNGLYEVIERDAFLTMWLNRIAMPMLECQKYALDFNKSINRINKYGMNVKLVDLTNDSLVPTVMAVCYNKNPEKYPALVIGTAAHVQTEKAVQKALFEMEIGLIHNLEKEEKKILDPNQISSIYENGVFYLNPETRKYWEFMISNNQSSDLPKLTGKEFKNHTIILKQIVKRLHSLGHRVVYVDITPSDIRNLGLVAVKVFVPGFQPLYSGNKLRISRNRLQESAEYVLNNIGKIKEGREPNSAPHPLA